MRDVTGENSALPVPVFDHVVVNVQERMDAAQACYRRLGFTLTPRGFHTLGSINHLAVFGTDYLESIGVPEVGAGRRDLVGWPVGLIGMVFATEDADALHAALRQGDVDCEAPQSFSRPVTLADGSRRDAAFRTVRLPNDTMPAGRLYFCAHATRDLVWRDEWRRHANGALGLVRAVIAAGASLRFSDQLVARAGIGVSPTSNGTEVAGGAGISYFW